jgi:hypothetical protein
MSWPGFYLMITYFLRVYIVLLHSLYVSYSLFSTYGVFLVPWSLVFDSDWIEYFGGQVLYGSF